MALFKISRGKKENLPSTYNDGYCYFTTDDGKFYIDTNNAADGRVCLNANAADKLVTARTIQAKGGTVAEAADAVEFDGSKNVEIPIGLIYSGGLSWGGAMPGDGTRQVASTDTSINRLAFIDPSYITIEYSRDGGSTWVDYDATDEQKTRIVSYSGLADSTLTDNALYLGKHSTINSTQTGFVDGSVQDQLRVTIKYPNNFMGRITDIIVNSAYAVYTSGAIATVSVLNYGQTNYTNLGSASLSGMYGDDSLGVSFFWPYQLTSSGYKNYITAFRVTFSFTGYITSSISFAPIICGISAIGTGFVPIGNSDPMSASGHLYSYDYSKNATFPAAVTGTSLTATDFLNYSGIKAGGEDNKEYAVWLGAIDNLGVPVYNNGLTYNPSTKTLTVDKISCASSESTASKLQHSLTVNGKTFNGESDVDVGIISIANGGTGASAAVDALSNLGAVAKSGDTMTGALTIKQATNADLMLTATSTDSSYKGFSTYLRSDTDGISSWNLSDTATTTVRALRIQSKTVTSVLDDALVFAVYENSTWTGHRIFHSGMETAIPIANGGTGASTAAGALTSLGALPLAGGTMTGPIVNSSLLKTSWLQSRRQGLINANTVPTSDAAVALATTQAYQGSWTIGTLYQSNNLFFTYVSDTAYTNLDYSAVTTIQMGSTGTITGAVWNDYAEYRVGAEELKPGEIAYSDDEGKLHKTTERLQAFEGAVSDTYGFIIGGAKEATVPIAVSGRVLVFPDENRSTFHAGDTVCAGANGTVSKMTREEIAQYPDRIVGVVSEIPSYKTWGSGNVAVNGRIWIRVK